jgi:hypothetical protein
MGLLEGDGFGPDEDIVCGYDPGLHQSSPSVVMSVLNAINGSPRFLLSLTFALLFGVLSCLPCGETWMMSNF